MRKINILYIYISLYISALSATDCHIITTINSEMCGRLKCWFLSSFVFAQESLAVGAIMLDIHALVNTAGNKAATKPAPVGGKKRERKKIYYQN